MVKLEPHQEEPVEFMKYNRALLLFHSTGSGKTLTALYSVYQFNYDIIIIGNKSSNKTFADNIKKAEMDPDRFSFYTFTKIKTIVGEQITFFANKSVIIDEAHAIRTENVYNMWIYSALTVASKIILLTATPVVNYINDMSVLVNIVKNEDSMPTDRKLFDQMFYDEESMQLINTDILFNKLLNTTSYYQIPQDDNYPTSKTHFKYVIMSHAQIDEYVYYIKKVLYSDQKQVQTIDILDIDYGLLPTKKRNTFLTVTRQLSNTVGNSSTSPKILEIFDVVKEGPFPIVVYSNFLKNGIYTLAILLEKNNITYKSITGFTTTDRINSIVNAYNNGSFKVLLISSAGSESLDLKNTRQIHIMEPHWNEPRIDQVIGRAIRYLSHANLPPEQRHVDIYRWLSVFPNRIKNPSADEYLADISNKKREMFETYTQIIKAASIENNYMKALRTNPERLKALYIKAKNRYHELGE